jgi:hypothetical protein
VLPGRGLFDELITNAEQSYRLWRVVVYVHENLVDEKTTLSFRDRGKKNLQFTWNIPLSLLPSALRLLRAAVFSPLSRPAMHIPTEKQVTYMDIQYFKLLKYIMAHKDPALEALVTTNIMHSYLSLFPHILHVHPQ